LRDPEISTLVDADKLTEWLAAACARRSGPELVRDELLVRCRAGRGGVAVAPAGSSRAVDADPACRAIWRRRRPV